MLAMIIVVLPLGSPELQKQAATNSHFGVGKSAGSPGPHDFEALKARCRVPSRTLWLAKHWASQDVECSSPHLGKRR